MKTLPTPSTKETAQKKKLLKKLEGTGSPNVKENTEPGTLVDALHIQKPGREAVWLLLLGCTH